MAASLKDPGSIPGGGPKRFHDSFNFVFYIVGECISCAADTYLATDLTCKDKYQVCAEDMPNTMLAKITFKRHFKFVSSLFFFNLFLRKITANWDWLDHPQSLF